MPREGEWGSSACKEDSFLAGFLQFQTALYQREEKLQKGTSKDAPKCSLQELDLRLSPLEEKGEKGRRDVKYYPWLKEPQQWHAWGELGVFIVQFFLQQQKIKHLSSDCKASRQL